MRLRKDYLIVFINAIFLRIIILCSVYSEYVYLVESSLFTLDFINHVRFVDDIFKGIFFYHTHLYATFFYSPVTPVLIAIFTYPILFITNNLLLSVIVSSSIWMGIKAIGMYQLFLEYDQNRWIAALVVVFNPWELIGVMSWGGLSVLVSSICVTYTLLIYRKMSLNKISERKAIPFMLMLIFISMLAHRTGIVLQLTTFIIYIYRSYRKSNLRLINLTKSQIVMLILSVISLIILYLFRIDGRILKTLDLGLEFYLDKLIFLLFSLFQWSYLLIITITGMILYLRYRDENTRLSDLEHSYMIMALIYQFIPFKSNWLSSRFYSIIDSLLLFFWVYAYYIISMKYNNRVKNSYKIYSVFIAVISAVIAYIALKVNVLDNINRWEN